MPRKENLRDKIYETLKRQIITNELPPNSYLDEKVLCAQMQVSRTPFREAISKLESDKFVAVVPQRGVTVSDLSIQSVIELFQVRKELEPLVLKMCKRIDKDKLLAFRTATEEALKKQDYSGLRRLDHELHLFLLASSENRHMIHIMTYISDQYQRVLEAQKYMRDQRAVRGAKEHIALINALLGDKQEEACSLMRQHIVTTEQFYYKSLMGEPAEEDGK